MPMSENEKWQALMFSCRQAAKIHNEEFHEPEYLDWKAGVKYKEDLWGAIRANQKSISNQSPSYLEQDGVNIVGKCNQSLIELRNMLKNEIEDERKASSMYKGVAVKLTALKLPYMSEALDSLSQDEAMHKQILEAIVDIITERCGE